MTAPCLWRELLRGPEPCSFPPPQKKRFPIFPSRAPFTEFLRLEKRCEGMIWNLEFILFFSKKPKNKSAWLKGSSIKNSYLWFLYIPRSLKKSLRMSFYKGLAYLVYLESLRVMHSNNGEIWKALFTYHWSGARLDPFHERKDHSASAILIGRVHAMRRRRWMFGKASLSHAPSASRRLLGSSFSADCHIICHLRSSFPRDLGNGRSFS